MEYNDVQLLKNEWGNKFCNHPKFEKEYYNGAFLTSYVCNICGKEFSVYEKMELEASRKKQKHH
jgi:hypothetical protein